MGVPGETRASSHPSGPQPPQHSHTQPHHSHSTATAQPHHSHNTATPQPHHSHTTATPQPHHSHTTATTQPQQPLQPLQHATAHNTRPFLVQLDIPFVACREMVWLWVIPGPTSLGLPLLVCAFGVPGQVETHGNSGWTAAFVASDCRLPRSLNLRYLSLPR